MPATYTDRINGLTTSLAVKAPCRVAATTNITLSGLQTISSVVLAAGDRVLLTGQTDAADNGIWVVSTSTWQRAKDFNGTRDVTKGTLVAVTATSGDVEYLELWQVTSDDPIVGTDDIDFVLAHSAPYVRVAHPAGPGIQGHFIPWTDENVDWIADRFTIGSDDPTVPSPTLTATGTATAGQSIGVRLTVDAVNHDYTYTVQSGDTLADINEALITAINADSAWEDTTLFALFADGSQYARTIGTPGVFWGVYAGWDIVPTVTNISQVGATTSFTIVQTTGILDTNPVFALSRAVTGRLGQAGDLLGTIIFYGDGDNNGTPSTGNFVYVQMGAGVVDPDINDPQGIYTISLAGGGYTQFKSSGVVVYGSPPQLGINFSGAQLLIDYDQSTAIARISNQYNTAMVLGTNNAERVRINAAGEVGVGGTAPAGNNMVVYGTDKPYQTAYNGNLAVMTTDTAAANKGGMLSLGGKGDANDFVVYGGMKGGKQSSGTNLGQLDLFTTTAAGPTNHWRITSPGHILPVTTRTYNIGAAANEVENIYLHNSAVVSSDLRGKEHVRESELGLSFLMDLKPISYTNAVGGYEPRITTVTEEVEEQIHEDVEEEFEVIEVTDGKAVILDLPPPS